MVRFIIMRNFSDSIKNMSVDSAGKTITTKSDGIFKNQRQDMNTKLFS